MAKMIISLILEETDENLNRIQGGLLKNYGRAIKGFSSNVIEEPKKEIDISMMYPKTYGDLAHK